MIRKVVNLTDSQFLALINGVILALTCLVGFGVQGDESKILKHEIWSYREYLSGLISGFSRERCGKVVPSSVTKLNLLIRSVNKQISTGSFCSVCTDDADRLSHYSTLLQ